MRKCLGLLLLLVSASAYATMYKWTDAHGNVQYSDKPPPAGMQSQTMAVSSGSSADDGANLPDGSSLPGLNQYTRAAYEKYRALGGSRAFFICQDGSVSTVKGATDENVDKMIKQQQNNFDARGCRMFARNNQLVQ